MLLAPSYFFLQYTTVCNSRCTTCSMWKLPHETIPPDVLERIGLFISPERTRSIYVTGGEPLLQPVVVDLAKTMDRWKPGLSMVTSTNGLLPGLYAGHVRQILDSGCHFRVQVSLNGLPETHDQTRGVVGSHDRAVETATKLRDMGALLSINILPVEGLTKPLDWSHVQQVAASLGVPAWTSPILRHNPWFGQTDDNQSVPYIENCRGGTDALTIRPNGDITACQEDREFLVFGNLRDDGLDPDRVRSVQEAVRTGVCQPCGCCTNSFSQGVYVG